MIGMLSPSRRSGTTLSSVTIGAGRQPLRSPSAVTALLVHVAGVNAWWLMPVCVLAALGWSLRRATTGRS